MTSPPPPATPTEQAGVWCLRLSDGSLKPEEQGEFDAWLDADPAHRCAFDKAVRAWQAVEQAQSSPELILMRTAALESFARTNRSRWTRGLSRWSLRAVAVAACVVLVAAGVGLWARMTPRTYETGVGERRVVMLPDRSRISLDAASKVTVRYAGDRRELRLEHGRAKFDVAKDAWRPFTVTAADKVVVATGTAFSVELLRKQIRVILYEGHVAVLNEQKGGATPKPLRLAARATPADQMLRPGRELVTSVAAPTAEVAPTDSFRSLSWESGQLVFVDEPLASAVERVNRYAETRIEVGDAAAGRVLINGVFTAGDAEAFVLGVTGIFPVRAITSSGGVKLISGRAERF